MWALAAWNRLAFKVSRREKSLGSILRRERDRLWKTCPGLGLQALWEQAAGPEVAGNTTVKAMRDGVMTVSCSSSSWACELSLKNAELIARLNELKPPEEVREIRFFHQAQTGWKSRK